MSGVANGSEAVKPGAPAAMKEAYLRNTATQAGQPLPRSEKHRTAWWKVQGRRETITRQLKENEKK